MTFAGNVYKFKGKSTASVIFSFGNSDTVSSKNRNILACAYV